MTRICMGFFSHREISELLALTCNLTGPEQDASSPTSPLVVSKTARIRALMPFSRAGRLLEIARALDLRLGGTMTEPGHAVDASDLRTILTAFALAKPDQLCRNLRRRHCGKCATLFY